MKYVEEYTRGMEGVFRYYTKGVCVCVCVHMHATEHHGS